uniref:Neur_chan_LBD domain-containing protein n=1 Tax=Heterorhabditis bacteriophora TaxID=37862 RepID=A0A1I7X354_HETBA
MFKPFNIDSKDFLSYAVVKMFSGKLDAENNLLRLYNSLLLDYEKEVRPSLRHDRPINVTFVFSLTQIIDVDERNQILTTNAWVRQHWTDYKLVWDPRNFDNLTKIHIPHEKIWKPDIILYNNTVVIIYSADSQYTKSVMSTDVIVDYLGNLLSGCTVSFRGYPYKYTKKTYVLCEMRV